VQPGGTVAWLRDPSRHSGALAFAALAIGIGPILAIAAWSQAYWALGFGGLVLAVTLSPAFDPRPSLENRASPLSFVIEMIALLLYGPSAMTSIAAIEAVIYGLAGPHLTLRLLLNTSIAVLATQAAGLAFGALGGSIYGLSWPRDGASLAAAVVAYCVVKSIAVDVIAPFSSGQPVNRSWAKNALDDCSSHFIGAGIAVGLIEVINHRAWEILPVAAVPLFFAYQAYAAHMRRFRDEYRRREAIAALDLAMAVVNNVGQVTLWNDALARMVSCPREQALGSSLCGALPALSQTPLPGAVHEALKSRKPQTLADLALTCSTSARTLNVKILPGIDDVMLLWYDVTEQTRARHALRRSQERLALAAEGANDGLWEWDLRTQEFYFSARWSEMIGSAAGDGSGRPDEWFRRVHPDDSASLKAALDAHLAGDTPHLQLEHRLLHENGTHRWYLCRGVARRGADRRPTRIAGSLTDVTERAIAQEHIRSAGFRDPLTGLCNRSVFVKGLGQCLTELKHRNGGQFAVLYLDLDRFKLVNDSLGHLVGDELLTAVSRRLESCLRPGDALARLGGDEFAILLNGLGDGIQANAIAFRIQAALGAPFSIGGREVFTSASIGIAFSRMEYANPEEMMRDADTAMYHAKARGRSRHELFDADMHARAIDRLSLESDLRNAINTHAFEVYYQPIVSLASRMCVGFEALVRWKRNGESVAPSKFIPVAEELGLIEPLGTWVLQQACCTYADWKRRFPGGGLECITVNVSTRQILQQNFLYIVEQAVRGAGLKPSDLRLEITETALMENPLHSAEVLRGLRDFGVKIYLDDFGTGYSSLSHPHKLPVDALKIDRSFVRSLLLDDRPAIVESILALARTLETSVVAEGVESDQQARELERLGCRQAQGFYFAPPLPIISVEEILSANAPLGDTHSSRLKLA
jgi:diguanylate cyclase (GGDEF)-like protein/PAS domain S-box-containing protein